MKNIILFLEIWTESAYTLLIMRKYGEKKKYNLKYSNLYYQFQYEGNMFAEIIKFVAEPQISTEHT